MRDYGIVRITRADNPCENPCGEALLYEGKWLLKTEKLWDVAAYLFELHASAMIARFLTEMTDNDIHY